MFKETIPVMVDAPVKVVVPVTDKALLKLTASEADKVVKAPVLRVDVPMGVPSMAPPLMSGVVITTACEKVGVPVIVPLKAPLLIVGVSTVGLVKVLLVKVCVPVNVTSPDVAEVHERVPLPLVLSNCPPVPSAEGNVRVKSEPMAAA